MTQAAAVVRILALAVWVGGIAVLDFVEAPLRFASGIIDRNQAVGLGQVVLTRWIRVEWALGGIILVASLIVASPGWSIWLIAVMLALVTVQGGYLAPAITHLAQGLDFVQRTAHDPRYATIRHLHTLFGALELLLLAAGVTVLAAAVRPGRR